MTHELLSSEFGLEKHSLALESQKLWADLITSLNSKIPHYEQVSVHKGTLIATNAQSGELEDKNFSAIKLALVNQQAKFEENVQYQDFGLEPYSTARPASTLYVPNECFICPEQLLKAYELYFSTLTNVELLNDSVLSIDYLKPTKKVATSSETLSCEQLVLASGASTQNFLEQFAVQTSHFTPRLLSGVGTGFLVELPNHNIRTVIRTPNRAGACGLHIVPRTESLLYIGASNYLSLTPEETPTISHLYYLIENIMRQFKLSLHKAKLLKTYVGNRPVAADAFPLLGELYQSGVWILSGTYRDGIHLSPAIASRFAKAFYKQAETISDLFLPDRKFISTMTPEESVDLAVMHYLDAGYGHGLELPSMGWSDLFKDSIRHKFACIYDELNLNKGLPTDLLTMISKDIPAAKKHLSAYLTEALMAS